MEDYSSLDYVPDVLFYAMIHQNSENNRPRHIRMYVSAVGLSKPIEHVTLLQAFVFGVP
jgi:hypothetical protein